MMASQQVACKAGSGVPTGSRINPKLFESLTGGGDQGAGAYRRGYAVEPGLGRGQCGDREDAKKQSSALNGWVAVFHLDTAGPAMTAASPKPAAVLRKRWLCGAARQTQIRSPLRSHRAKSSEDDSPSCWPTCRYSDLCIFASADVDENPTDRSQYLTGNAL
jgi:hypothetical protein